MSQPQDLLVAAEQKANSSDSQVIREMLGRKVPSRQLLLAARPVLPCSSRLDLIARSLQGQHLLLFDFEWAGDLFQAEWNPRRTLELLMSATPSGRAQFKVESAVYSSYGSPVPGFNYGGHDLHQAIAVCQTQCEVLETIGNPEETSAGVSVVDRVRRVLTDLI